MTPSFGFVRQGFALAPDGQTLAFDAKGSDGIARIFVRPLDGTEARPLAGTDRATQPFWAPDSRSLAFFRDDGLYRTDLSGREPIRICDAAGRSSFFGGTWGTQGTIVFGSINSGLLRVKDTGGTPVQMTTLDTAAKEVVHSWPYFLPDGRHVLFLALAAARTTGVVWAVSIDNPARTRIVESGGGAIRDIGGRSPSGEYSSLSRVPPWRNPAATPIVTPPPR